jgi:hypothetical protein
MNETIGVFQTPLTSTLAPASFGQAPLRSRERRRPTSCMSPCAANALLKNGWLVGRLIKNIRVENDR